jgi:hypothetical protein
MKKLLTILILLCSVVSFSQAPRQLNAYNPSTQVNFLGTMATDSGLVFRTNFADTTTANLGWIKNIPNVLITINDTLYKRSNDVTHWMQVGSGSGGGGNTIYTGDGSLSGDRIIDPNGHFLKVLTTSDTYSQLYINPSILDGQTTYIAANSPTAHTFIGAYSNSDDGYAFSIFSDNQGDGTKNVDLVGNCLDGSIYMRGNGDLSLKNIDGTVSLVVNGTNSTIIHTADTHTFNGVHFNIANLQNFANNAAAITGGLNVGDLYYTNTAGDGVLKIVL